MTDKPTNPPSHDNNAHDSINTSRPDNKVTANVNVTATPNPNATHPQPNNDITAPAQLNTTSHIPNQPSTPLDTTPKPKPIEKRKRFVNVKVGAAVYKRYARYGQKLTPAQKAIVKTQVLNKVGSKSAIAAANKITRETLYRIVEDESIDVLSTANLDITKKGLITAAYSNALLAQKSVTKEKLDKSSFVQLMVGSKIATEQARLMEEKSTTNVSVIGALQTFANIEQDFGAKLKALDDKLNSR